MKIAVIFLLLCTSVFARLGETKDQLVARFGNPVNEGIDQMGSHGRNMAVGPELVFTQKDWIITCDLVDGRCARISYRKQGDWTEEQIQVVLAVNRQGGTWAKVAEQSGEIFRTWKRDDGATAGWTDADGISITTPAYLHAKAILEAKAKAESSVIPNI